MARRVVVRNLPDGTISVETLRSNPPVSEAPRRRERDSMPPVSVRELILSHGNDAGRQFGSSVMDVGRRPKFHR